MVNASIRYGASLRKRYNSIKEKKRAKYKCNVCGKEDVVRIGTSIWRCKHCNTTYAGGAYSLSTQRGELAIRLIKELKENKYNKTEAMRAIEVMTKSEVSEEPKSN